MMVMMILIFYCLTFRLAFGGVFRGGPGGGPGGARGAREGWWSRGVAAPCGGGYRAKNWGVKRGAESGTAGRHVSLCPASPFFQFYWANKIGGGSLGPRPDRPPALAHHPWGHPPIRRLTAFGIGQFSPDRPKDGLGLKRSARFDFSICFCV